MLAALANDITNELIKIHVDPKHRTELTNKSIKCVQLHSEAKQLSGHRVCIQFLNWIKEKDSQFCF